MMNYDEVKRKSESEQGEFLTPPVEYSEEFFLHLFLKHPYPTYLYELEGLRILKVNEMMCRHYGYTEEEFLRMTLPDLRPEHEVKRLKTYLKEHPPSKDKFDRAGEWKHRKKDGTLITVEVSTHQFTFRGKRAVFAVLKDITQMKAAYQEVQYSEERLRRLSDAAFEGVVVHQNEIICEVNQAILEMLGYESPDELIGKNIFDYISPNYRTLSRRKVAERSEVPYEMLMCKKNGEEITVQVRGRTIPYRGGFARVAALNDITDWKRNERLLLDRENRLRIVVEQLPAIIWTTDTNMVILSSSGGQIGKHIPDHASNVGKTLQEVIGVTDPTCLPYVKTAAALRGESVTYEMEYRGVDFVTCIEPLRDAKGEVIGTVGLTMDVSVQKGTEKALREITTQLERSNKELEQFASVISHDLQQPLRTIITYLSMIQRDCKLSLEPETHQQLNYVVNAATRMSQLIKDLLNLSKLSERVPDVPSSINFSTVASEALQNLEILVTESKAEIIVDKLPTTELRGSKSEWIQLFQNLVGNALKFRDPKRPSKIKISVYEKVNSWEFSVADNGIGFKAKHSERIFEMFQRLHSSEKYPGTGIGLFICQNIIQKHNGRIWAESVEGQGSTFYFTLPKLLE